MPGSVRVGIHLDDPRAPRHPVEHSVDEPDVTSADISDRGIFTDNGTGRQMRHMHQFARACAQDGPVKHRQPVQCPPFGETVSKSRVQLITVAFHCGCQRIEVPVINVLDAK